MEIKGRDVLSGLPRTTEIRTNEVVRAISRELREMIKAIKDVFQDTPPELAADIIDGGIIMTGGTSQLRNFPELVRRRSGVKAYLADQALFCVATGTGIALEHLDMYKRTVLAKDRLKSQKGWQAQLASLCDQGFLSAILSIS